MFDATLAEGFDLRQGFVQVKVPFAFISDNYTVTRTPFLTVAGLLSLRFGIQSSVTIIGLGLVLHSGYGAGGSLRRETVLVHKTSS